VDRAALSARGLDKGGDVMALRAISGRSRPPSSALPLTLALLVFLLLGGCASAPPPEEQSPTAAAKEEGVAAAEQPPEGAKAGKAGELGAEPGMPAGAVEDRQSAANAWAEALMSEEDGEYREALDAVVRYRAQKPEDDRALTMEARLRYQLDDAGRGLALLERMMARGLGGLEVVDTYVTWAVDKRQVTRASDTLEKLIAEEGAVNAEVAASLGYLYYKAGDREGALDTFASIESTAAVKRFAPFVAKLKLDTGDTEGARALIDEMTRNAVDTMEGGGDERENALLLLGELERGQGRASAAERIYMEVLEKDPDNYDAKVSLGVLELGQGDNETAHKLFEEAAASQPGRPGAWSDLGIVLRRQGKHKEALAAYEKARAADPRYAPVLRNLGILHEKYFGDPETAIGFYKSYLEQVGEDGDVERWLKAATRLAEKGDT